MAKRCRQFASDVYQTRLLLRELFRDDLRATSAGWRGKDGHSYIKVVFSAHALHQFPVSAAALRTGGQPYMDAFISEVRRFYLFFPAVPARVRKPFRWRGHDFPRNRRVTPDLYETNHDERAWRDAETFQPRRFLLWKDNATRLPALPRSRFVMNEIRSEIRARAAAAERA